MSAVTATLVKSVQISFEGSFEKIPFDIDRKAFNYVGSGFTFIKLSIEEKTTGAALRQLISEKTKIPIDHLKLKMITGANKVLTKTQTTDDEDKPIEVYHTHVEYGYQSTVSNDSILHFPETIITERSEGIHRYITTHMPPYLSFSLEKCSNTKHCSKIILFNAPLMPNIAIGFDASTTLLQLKNRIFEKTNIPLDSQHLRFNGQRFGINSDEKTLEELGLYDESSIEVCIYKEEAFSTKPSKKY